MTEQNTGSVPAKPKKSPRTRAFEVTFTPPAGATNHDGSTSDPFVYRVWAPNGNEAVVQAVQAHATCRELGPAELVKLDKGTVFIGGEPLPPAPAKD